MRFSLLPVLLVAAACGRAADSEPPVMDEPAVPADVALAVRVANGLTAHPTAADSVLRANGLTRTGLDSLLYRIAADSAMAAQYEAGRR